MPYEWKPAVSAESSQEKMRKKIELSIYGEVYIDSIRISENRLGKLPSGIIVEAEGLDGGKKDIFVSRFVASDPNNSLTEEWKKLNEFMVLPNNPEDKI